MSVLQSSRRQHDHNIESVFVGPLKILREHVGPYALQTCYKQMELSMYYKTEVLQLPEGMHNWVSTINFPMIRVLTQNIASRQSMRFKLMKRPVLTG